MITITRKWYCEFSCSNTHLAHVHICLVSRSSMNNEFLDFVHCGIYLKQTVVNWCAFLCQTLFSCMTKLRLICHRERAAMLATCFLKYVNTVDLHASFFRGLRLRIIGIWIGAMWRCETQGCPTKLVLGLFSHAAISISQAVARARHLVKNDFLKVRRWHPNFSWCVSFPLVGSIEWIWINYKRFENHSAGGDRRSNLNVK